MRRSEGSSKNANHLLAGRTKAELLGIKFESNRVVAGSNLLGKFITNFARIFGIILVAIFDAEHASAKKRGDASGTEVSDAAREWGHARGSEVLLDFQNKTGVKYGFGVTIGRINTLRDKVCAVPPAAGVING